MNASAPEVRDGSHGDKVRRGQDRARAAGVRIGRPPNPSLREVLQQAQALRARGASIRDIVAALGVPRSTLHRALCREEKRAR